VLLVDDHQLMREGLRAIIDNAGTLRVVGEASSGREAIRQASLLRPDVVIMDVVMKELNGIEATREILRLLPEVVVVALSSHADAGYARAMLDAGASAYVLKADAYDQLYAAVQAALAGSTHLSTGLAYEVEGERRPLRPSVYHVLGPREREVLQLVAEGYSSQEIARRLFVAVATVETHRRNLMRKLGIHGVAELTKYAIREGLTQADG